jgi:2-keto-4-pentenoate hydratase/2-oxohepta-3-ene-1,7-dioic acid hydratase (catechol pathway)
MRLVTYDAGDGPRAGALRDGEVVDVFRALGGDSPGGPASVRALLESGRIDDAAAAVESADAPRTPLEAVRLLPPIPDPDKLIGIGLNYRSHAEEAGLDPPATPTFFAKYRNSLAAPGAEVALPAASEKVDYEAEVAFVVGRRARDVGETDAIDHIAGYTLLNDLSARTFSSPPHNGCRARSSTDRLPAGRLWSPPTRPGRLRPSRSSWCATARPCRPPRRPT